jgi:uncharacterized protein
MKRRFFSCWLILLSQVALAQLRKVEIFYDAEKKQIKESYAVSTIRPVRIEGWYVSFYPNGKEKSKGNFQAGLQQGGWEFFYENGNRKMTGSMEKNQRNGFWKYFYESGKVSSAGNLKNGIREGEWKYFYENEEIKSEGNYTKGKKNSTWSYYFEDGTPKATADYIDDKGFYREYNRKSKKVMEGWIVNGQSDSTWTYFYESGQIKASGLEKNGVRRGLWKLFHENGKLAAEGNYKNGIEEGSWTYFYENGIKSAKGKQLNGQKEGNWKLYYPTGNFKAEGGFTDGSGLYREFYESGKRKAEGFVQKGISQGLWKYYYEDGITLDGQVDFKDGEGLYKGYYPDGKTLKMQGIVKNGRRIGTWEIFNADGTTEGYLKHYLEEEKQGSDFDFADEKDARVDSLLTAKTAAKKNTKKKHFRSHKTQLRYFKPRINEFKGLILSVNPVALVLSQLPLSAEYYFQERLGYELTYTLFRDPLLKKDADIPLNNLYLRGFSVGLKQKFYQPDKEIGMFYFGHEVRFSDFLYKNNTIDDITLSPQILEAQERRYEYALFVGNRWMAHAGSNGFSVDVFGGLGAGYRKYKEKFAPDSKFRQPFDAIKKNAFVISPHIGFSLGYAF